MIIHSLAFFGFTAVVLLLYYLLPRKQQNYLLLAASYTFYITFSWQFTLILIFMTAVNYGIGKKIEKEHPTRKWLGAAVGFNLMVLFFFRLANFFVADVLEFLSGLGLSIQAEGLKILLPIGLSFYVLQAISYQVDVYRGQVKVCPNPVDFALYLAYFPKLTAGPIERAQAFLIKLERLRVVDSHVLARSFTLVVIGLVRKVVIADTLLQAIPANVFATPMEYSTIELVAWLAAYAFGLYNDFCGYTNIVRGVSGFFGIELSRNFMNPVFSRGFTEFWNRWHITLSHWLRDYIYFPLSRALVRRNPRLTNPANIILPPMVTMLASGIWHGTGWNFLVWGGLMGVFLVVERFFSLGKPVTAPDRKPVWKRFLSMAVVWVLAPGSLIIFLMDFPTAGQFLRALFTNTGWVLPGSRVFIVILLSLWIDFVQHRRGDEFIFLSWRLFPRAWALAIAVLFVFLFSLSQIPTPFIYQGF